MTDGLERISANLTDAINTAVRDASNRITRRIVRHRASILKKRRKPLIGFEQRLYERWQEGIDLYEL
jgi:hypothetical protein